MNGPYFSPLSKTNLFLSKSLFLILLALFVLAGVGVVIAQVTAAPDTPPDSAAGLATFSERCANCHGPAGQGDGELAVNLPAPPRNFTDPAFLRQAVPADMFDTITNGRIEAGMPPFGPSSTNPLSDASRWEAVAAVYSLGTPPESIEQGRVVYEENCMACHGESGEGDGAEAAELGSPPSPLTDLTYWSSISNQAVFDMLSDDGRIPAHDFALPEDALWSVVDYIRTFSYLYVNPQAALEPVDEATVSGVITNGTTGELAEPGTAVRLRAFTIDLNVALTLTTTVEAEGQYHFDLSDIPPDWFLRTAVFYEDIEFGSDFDQVSLSRPDLDLPIVVYEKTTDPAAITITQLHTILRFAAEDQVEVNQLYVVSNAANTVYAGPSGDISEGTVELVLPPEAQLLGFQRGLGSVDNLFPTEDLIPTTQGWADTLPVRPGQGSLMLLARYTMPYNEDGITLSHPLLYETAEVSLVVPEEITVSGPDTWQDTGLQTLENGTFATYRQGSLPAAAVLSATIEGRPSPAAVGGSLVRNESAELLLGGGVLLIAVAAAIYAVRQWQSPAFDVKSEKKALLQAIADLDNEYEAGQMSESDYLEEREALMADLKAIWKE